MIRRVHQVHGATVVDADTVASGTVGDAAGNGAGAAFPDGDALVGRGTGHVLAVLVADCAAVALASADGSHGAVHAGWRGLVAGVVEKAVAAVAELGGTSQVVAGLGPCIGPCCYEFTGPALDELADRYGPDVRAVTAQGAPALDLRQAVRRALWAAGAQLVVEDTRCTGCSPDAWSHRRRGDQARQALLVWRAPGP